MLLSSQCFCFTSSTTNTEREDSCGDSDSIQKSIDDNVWIKEQSKSYDLAAPSDIRCQSGQLFDSHHIFPEIAVLISIEVYISSLIDERKSFDSAILQVIEQYPCALLIEGIVDDCKCDVGDVWGGEESVHR